MRTYSKEELLERAVPYFKNGHDLLYATVDGNLFHKEHKTHAMNHQATLKSDTLFELRAEDLKEKEPETEEVKVKEEVKKTRKKINNGTK